MHKVVSQLQGDRLVPSVALVCYSRSEVGRHEIGFVSRHPVVVEKDVPRILPGEPLREGELREIVSALWQSDLRWIDPRVLAQCQNTRVWWAPPAKRTLWWKPVEEFGTDYDALPTRAHAIPLPGFVFRLDLQPYPALGVFAVKGNSRPTPRTALFHAPFANVYDLGGVCMGSSPKEGDWEAWETAFFASVFTHDVGSLKRVQAFKHSFQALDALAESKEDAFPEKWLRPLHRDLGWYIAEGRGGEQRDLRP